MLSRLPTQSCAKGTLHTPTNLEARLQQLEDGKLVTEKMSDIVSLEDDTGSQDLGIKLQLDGKISAARTST